MVSKCGVSKHTGCLAKACHWSTLKSHDVILPIEFINFNVESLPPRSYLSQKRLRIAFGVHTRAGYIRLFLPGKKAISIHQESGNDGHPLFQTNPRSLRPSHAARGSWLQSPANNEEHHIPACRDPSPNCYLPRPHTDHAARAGHHCEPRP